MTRPISALELDPDALRTDFYVRPSFFRKDGYRQDVGLALVNLVTRLAIGAMLGYVLYCLGAFFWFALTQTIPAVTNFINGHIPALPRHAIRDGDFERFSAVIGAAIVFVKSAKDVKKKEDGPGFIYRFMLFLHVPNKYQEKPTTKWQFIFGYVVIYLTGIIGLAGGTCLLWFWGDIWSWFNHFPAIHAFTSHVYSVIKSNPITLWAWNWVLLSALKYVPSILGLLFFAHIPQSQLTRDAQLVITKALVERDVPLRWPVPGNIRDLAGDLRYMQVHDGVAADAPDSLLGWMLLVGFFAMFLAGFGSCIIQVVAKKG